MTDMVDVEEQGYCMEVEVVPTMMLKPLQYMLHFKDDTLPNEIYKSFEEGDPEIFKIYYDCFGGYFDFEEIVPGKKRRMKIKYLRKSLETLRMPSTYLFSWAHYVCGCTHKRDEIKNGDIKDCKCYNLICDALVNHVETITPKGFGKEVKAII